MVSLQIKPNTYYDSITLMIISKELKKVPGVKEALVGMGTDLNLDIAKVTVFPAPSWKPSPPTISSSLSTAKMKRPLQML